MRIRTIKPEWLASQKLAGASDAARVLSVALILMADDHGRGRGSIAEIAMQTWRYDMTREDGAKARETLAKVRETLEELSATGFVVLYQVDGDDFFELPGWADHQRVDKPGKAKIPPSSAASGKLPETLAKVPGTLATDQGSGIRDQGGGSGKPEAPPPAQPTQTETASPKLLTLGDAVRKELEAGYRRKRLSPDPACNNMLDPRWVDTAKWAREVAGLNGLDEGLVIRETVAQFFADYPCSQKGWKPGFYFAGLAEWFKRSDRGRMRRAS